MRKKGWCVEFTVTVCLNVTTRSGDVFDRSLPLWLALPRGVVVAPGEGTEQVWAQRGESYIEIKSNCLRVSSCALHEHHLSVSCLPFCDSYPMSSVHSEWVKQSSETYIWVDLGSQFHAFHKQSRALGVCAFTAVTLTSYCTLGWVDGPVWAKQMKTLINTKLRLWALSN